MRTLSPEPDAGGGPPVPLHCTRHLLLSAVAGLALLLAADSGIAAPDTATDKILEEILVTARRREESSIAVPMSLTRLDGAMLDSLQYRDIEQFLSLSPGVLVAAGGDGASSMIAIRGVVSPGEFVEPGNSVYVDDIYVSGMRTVLPGFYDIQSVQVLKGPQAGLYGRNTTGGAVIITTGKPTEELSARLNSSYAQYDARAVDGTVNVPLSNVLWLRSSLWYSDRDGGYYQSHLVNQNLDARRERGGRLTIAVMPSDRTRFTLTTEVDEKKESGFSSSGGLVAGALLGPAPLAAESRRNVLRDDPAGQVQDIAGINSRLDFDTAAGTLVAVAGWRELKVREPGSDWDGTAYAASYADFLADPSTALATPSPQITTREDRNQGVNADVHFLTADEGAALRALFGINYFGEATRLFDQVLPVGDFARILAATGRNGSATRRFRQDSASWAGFTELIWVPAPYFEITADLRYTHNRKDIDSRLSASGYYSSTGGSAASLDTSDTFKNWSPGITLAYKPNEALTVYGKYVRGFRAGGFNALVNDPALQSYGSEESENYELGFKSLLLDGRLELGASLFYLRVNNALVPQYDPGIIDFFPLQNPGTAETTGLELDLVSQVSDRFAVTASAGAYDYSLSNGGLVGGDQRPFAPDYTASLILDYQLPLTPALTTIATLGYRHRSGGRVPALTWIDMDSYNLVDAQLGIRFNRVQVAGFVQNALDNKYVVSNYGLVGGQLPYVAASGLDLSTTRALVRDQGSVFGIRLTVTL